MRLKARRNFFVASAATAATIGSLAVAAPAMAAFASCTVNIGATSCTSGALRANASGHWLDYEVGGGTLPCLSADWRVFDTSNNVTVKSGHVGSGDTSGRIPGLFGSYKIKITSSCWDAEATIDNE